MPYDSYAAAYPVLAKLLKLAAKPDAHDPICKITLSTGELINVVDIISFDATGIVVSTEYRVFAISMKCVVSISVDRDFYRDSTEAKK